MLFEIKDIDRVFYEEELKDFLPDKFIDIHTHVWLKEHNLMHLGSQKTQTWPMKVANQNPIEHLEETYRLLFPGKDVSALIFAMPECNIEDNNRYIYHVKKDRNYPALLLTKPQWSAEKFENEIFRSGCLGAKVYLNLANDNIHRSEITIFDFLPHHQLEILNKKGWIVMLHIPGDLRLKDPVNIKQLLEIEKKYANLKLIVAHVGRAYCDEDLGNSLEILANTQNMMFDFSANTNNWIFEQLIKAVGPDRILFGSDLPITRMRMKRITEEGRYINIVPKNLYGNVSNDPHMREVDKKDSENLTFFIYEEIKAFKIAAQNTHLTKDEIKKVFHDNAQRIINSAGSN